MDIASLMLTGDNERTKRVIAGQLGMDVRAGLLPDQKLREIEALKARGPVVMVDDDINDAPALADRHRRGDGWWYGGGAGDGRRHRIPGASRLSLEAEAALTALRAASDDAVRGRVWHAVEKAGPIAGEIAAFQGAVERRLGADAVRQMLRTEGRAGAVTSASVAPGQRTALDQVSARISTIRSGERAGADLTQKQGERERLTRRRGLRI